MQSQPQDAASKSREEGKADGESDDNEHGIECHGHNYAESGLGEGLGNTLRTTTVGTRSSAAADSSFALITGR